MDSDPVDRFIAAFNAADLQGLEACLHPDFEMVVPQKPDRGFIGREQEMKNMRFLLENYPGVRLTLLRKAVNGQEIWIETIARGPGIEMSAVVIWAVDRATGTLRSGRYFSEPVQQHAASIDEFMQTLGRGDQTAPP